MYIDCEHNKVEVDPGFLSVNDIKEIVSKLWYIDDRIQTVYFCKPNLPFEDSLVVIESDTEVRELIGLLTSLIMFVYMLTTWIMTRLNKEEGIRRGIGLKMIITLQMMIAL